MKEILIVFSRLGLLGFGGPVAAIAMMEDEVSRKRGWLSTKQFNELYAICKLLPGPVATQMAIYLGRKRGGIGGGLLSGICFILPAFIIVLSLSYFYVRIGASAKLASTLLGMQAGALVIILSSTLQLSTPYRKNTGAWIIAAVSAVLVTFSPGLEPLIILACGIGGASFYYYRTKVQNKIMSLLLPGLAVLPIFTGLWAQLAVIFPESGVAQIYWQLFWMCFKAGAFVFGTGLAVVPVLEADAVQHFHWLTHSEFMDALAIGQITPGPVVIAATFIGFKTAGLFGALAATFGMFLPAFVNILFLVPRLWERFSGTEAAQGFSAWAIPAVIGGILGSTVHLGWLTLHSTQAVIIFVGAMTAEYLFTPPAWLLLVLAGAAGTAWHF